VDLEALKAKLEDELKRQLVSASVLLGHMRVVDESSRHAFQYIDNRYAPFYYHLGKHIKPRNILKIGFRLGLLSGCFLKSCQTVEDFLAFQSDVALATRLGTKNIKDIYKNSFRLFLGDFLSDEFKILLQTKKWDFVIFNEETRCDDIRLHLDLVWPNMEIGGLVVVDYVNYHKPTKGVYHDFCKAQNREPVVVNTRYGVGLIER
jgi:hypothetical protein